MGPGSETNWTSWSQRSLRWIWVEWMLSLIKILMAVSASLVQPLLSVIELEPGSQPGNQPTSN